MPFLPCSFFLPSWHLQPLPTKTHLSTCWTHTHTDTVFIRMYLRTKAQKSDGLVSPFSTFLCPSFLTSSGCDEDDTVSSVSSACCRARCQCSVNTRSCPCDGLLLRFHPPGSGYLGPWDFILWAADTLDLEISSTGLSKGQPRLSRISVCGRPARRMPRGFPFVLTRVQVQKELGDWVVMASKCPFEGGRVKCHLPGAETSKESELRGRVMRSRAGSRPAVLSAPRQSPQALRPCLHPCPDVRVTTASL